MNPKQIQEGHLDVCERLGDHPVFAESWLSAAGDVRWKSGHMVEFQHLVESRARKMLRNRKSGLRPAEEYGVPLVGPEKLSSAGVPELVHTKADGMFAFMKALERLPLQQLARSVPHGLRQSKLFEALISHQIPMPRAIWLVKIIYLNRTKSAAERSSVWTKDLCQYIGELLRKGFVPKPTKHGNGESTATQQLSHENKWDYVLALVRWCVSARILDQELFLNNVIELMERAKELFGAEHVASVTGELLLILVPFVPYAIGLHRLTGRLAAACINILRQISAHPTTTLPGRTAPIIRLDESAIIVVFDILRELLDECPDAFLVLKIELPTPMQMWEVRQSYPSLSDEHFSRLDSCMNIVRERIGLLKLAAAPTAISERRLDVILLLDRILAKGNYFEDVHKYVERSPVLKAASTDQRNSLQGLISTICTWSMPPGSDSVQLGPRRIVAAKLLQKLGHSISENGGDKKPENKILLQTEIYALLEFTFTHCPTDVFADLNRGKFVEWSELINTMIESGVITLEGLTSHLIITGSVEAKQPKTLSAFYGALLLRLRPTEHACQGNSTLKMLRGTCNALIESARNSLGCHIGSKRKADADMDMLLPTEDALNDQVSQIVEKVLSDGVLSDMNALNLNPFNIWNFASEYSRRAVKSASTKKLINSIAVMQMTKYDAPLVEFLEGLLNAENDICREAILSHLSNYRHAVSPHIEERLDERAIIRMDWGDVISGVVSPYEDRIPGVTAASGSVESVLAFCKKHALSLLERADAPSIGVIAVSTMVIELIAAGIVMLQHALTALISDASCSSNLWIVALLSNDSRLHSALPFATSKALHALQSSISPRSIICALVYSAAGLIERTCSHEAGWLSSSETLKAVFEHPPSCSAFHRAHSVVSLVRNACANLDNAAIPEKVALVLLKGMNGGDSNHDKPLEQRVHDVFISLDIHRLSQQVAELQLLRAQMLVDAEDVLQTKHQKVVAGAKEEALHDVHKTLVLAIMAASSRRSPQEVVLVAEVVIFLEIRLANAALQKIQEAESNVDEHLVLSLLAFGGPPLQAHIGLIIKHSTEQLDALTKNPEKDGVLSEASVTEKLKLILPLLGFVLGNKASRQALCFALFKLLEASRDSIDTLVVVFCILIRGNLPPWHAAFSKLKLSSPALGFTFPSGPSRLRPAVLSRLQAGVNVSTDSVDNSETDPWTLLDGGVSSGVTGKAAPFLKGSVRVPHSELLAE